VCSTGWRQHQIAGDTAEAAPLRLPPLAATSVTGDASAQRRLSSECNRPSWQSAATDMAYSKILIADSRRLLEFADAARSPCVIVTIIDFAGKLGVIANSQSNRRAPRERACPTLDTLVPAGETAAGSVQGDVRRAGHQRGGVHACVTRKGMPHRARLGVSIQLRSRDGAERP
jgi:hypothetical protein